MNGRTKLGTIAILGALVGPLVGSLMACGGGSGSADAGAADAAPNPGFTTPNAPIAAFTGSGTTFTPATLDMSCLNTPSGDMPTTVDVTLNTEVSDFQSGDPVANSSVTVFPGIAVGSPFNAAVVSGLDGTLSLAIPTGQKRIGFKMVTPAYLDTLLLNQQLDPTMAVQTQPEVIQSVSNTTAETLSGFVDVTRQAGTGVIAGEVFDCAGNTIKNFVATVSSTSGTATQLPGALSFYFSASARVPLRVRNQPYSSEDGLFVTLQLPPTATAYVQMWGYLTQADLTAGTLTLLSELEIPVIADTVITGGYFPTRTN